MHVHSTPKNAQPAGARPANGHAHRSEPEHTALADVIETRDALIVEVELPGIAECDIRVELEGEWLTVMADRKLDVQPGRTHHHSERRHGRFARRFALPTIVDPDAARATYADGLLTIELPKREDARPRTIRITSTSTT